MNKHDENRSKDCTIEDPEVEIVAENVENRIVSPPRLCVFKQARLSLVSMGDTGKAVLSASMDVEDDSYENGEGTDDKNDAEATVLSQVRCCYIPSRKSI